MKNTYKIVINGNPIQLEIGRNVLDIAIRISSYINNNFDASDFFTIGHTRDYVVAEFLDALQEAQGRIKLEDDKVILSLKRDLLGYFNSDQCHMLERVLWYGSNFGDDIPEFELFHDDMWDIYHACFP